MKLLVHSSYSAQSIGANLGKKEYSYYFVLAGYLPALAQLGEVVTIADPESEVDAIFDACVAAGEACVFLCFAPPHLVPITLRCPTIPVVAWEFSTIPCEVWGDDPRCDWRVVFAHCGRVITLSNHTAALVREVMGEDFPVFAIPTATFEAFADIGPPRLAGETALLRLRGYLFDSATDARLSRDPSWPPVPAPHFGPQPEMPAAPSPPPRATLRKRVSITIYYLRAWYHEVLRDVLPSSLKRFVSFFGRIAYRTFQAVRKTPPPALPMEPLQPVQPVEPLAPAEPECEVTLSGVVYVSVFAPQDGRKNWQDLLTGFLRAFRENPAATLFLKLPVRGGVEAYPAMHWILGQFAPLKCRVVFFAGFLEDSQIRDLIRATTYYVNTSHAEGLCLPLMEFLSAGRPSLAPQHTAMADYINADIAFVLQASLEHNVWPFDPRDIFTTMRYRLNWQSLVTAYEESYLLAAEDAAGYRAMREAAQNAMRKFCALPVVRAKLAGALGMAAAAAVEGTGRVAA